MENKIIQIAVAGHDATAGTQSNGTLYALDSYGNIYGMPIDWGHTKWFNVPSPLPDSGIGEQE